MQSDVQLLDDQIPLADASFGDAAVFAIDIPMRYAEFCAWLRNGKTVRLRNRSQLLGWSGTGRRRDYYFHTDAARILKVRMNNTRRQPIRAVDCWENAALCRAQSASDPRLKALGSNVHKIITVDGSLCFASPEPCLFGSHFTATWPTGIARGLRTMPSSQFNQSMKT